MYRTVCIALLFYRSMSLNTWGSTSAMLMSSDAWCSCISFHSVGDAASNM